MFDALVAIVFLALSTWLVRSPTFKQLLRGRGTDPGQFGSRLDHLENLGSGTAWNDDGRPGTRESYRPSKQTRRRS